MLRHRLHCKIERAETETYLTGKRPVRAVLAPSVCTCTLFGTHLPATPKLRAALPVQRVHTVQVVMLMIVSELFLTLYKGNRQHQVLI